jgi:hypothetical protein
MSTNFNFRKQAVARLTRQIGVYVLCDLDNIPVYVGQSKDGIRQRVQRHLTSARSDVIANRQIDVWEIAFVWEYPVEEKSDLDPLEAALFHNFNTKSRLMNGTNPLEPIHQIAVPEPANVIQVMADHEISERKSTEQRLPRQALHYAQLVGHFVAVKNSDQIASAMDAHFERLTKYHALMLDSSSPE